MENKTYPKIHFIYQGFKEGDLVYSNAAAPASKISPQTISCFIEWAECVEVRLEKNPYLWPFSVLEHYTPPHSVTSQEKWVGATKCLSLYPEGTKAQALGGGYWIKTKLGWKWCTGSTFPTVGGDWSGQVCEPEEIDKPFMCANGKEPDERCLKQCFSCQEDEKCDTNQLKKSRDAFYMHLIDVVWGDANEDVSVPSTHHAEYLLQKARETFGPRSEPYTVYSETKPEHSTPGFGQGKSYRTFLTAVNESSDRQLEELNRRILALQTLCKMAQVPDYMLETFSKADINQDDINWAKKIIDKHK